MSDYSDIQTRPFPVFLVSLRLVGHLPGICRLGWTDPAVAWQTRLPLFWTSEKLCPPSIPLDALITTELHHNTSLSHRSVEAPQSVDFTKSSISVGSLSFGIRTHQVPEMPFQTFLGPFQPRDGTQAPLPHQTLLRQPRRFDNALQASQTWYVTPQYPADQPSNAVVHSQPARLVGPRTATTISPGYTFAFAAERDADGETFIRPHGHPSFVVNDQPLAIVPHGDRCNFVARQDELIPPGTRILAHLPLDEEDSPNTHAGVQRNKFRNLINNINDLDRIRPDLEVAKSNNWHQKVAKLTRHLKSLEKQISGPLQKNADCPIFRKLVPTFPQLWKYLGQKQRNITEQTASRPPRARRIEDTPAPTKDEDSKDYVLEAIASLRHPVPAESQRPRGFDPIKQENGRNGTNELEAGVSAHNASRTSVSTPFENIKAEPEDSDSDDCTIICERKVLPRSRATSHRNITISLTDARSPSGGHQSTAASTQLEIPTRSLRNREVPLVTTRQRSRSPFPRSQVYRNRSPRRDAVVEELSDSE